MDGLGLLTVVFLLIGLAPILWLIINEDAIIFKHIFGVYPPKKGTEKHKQVQKVRINSLFKDMNAHMEKATEALNWAHEAVARSRKTEIDYLPVRSLQAHLDQATAEYNTAARVARKFGFHV